MKFHFKTDDGRTCCRTEEREHLCPSCAEQAKREGTRPRDLPTLIDRMRMARGLPVLEVREGLSLEPSEFVTW